MANHQDSSMFMTGDVVIGSTDPSKSVYSATGSKIIEDGVSLYGSERDIASQQQEITQSLLRSGGKRIAVQENTSTAKKKKTSKRKFKDNTFSNFEIGRYGKPSPDNYTEAEDKKPMKLTTVQFENDFGMIRAKVEHLVEHPMAFMLVFSDNDSIVFEPKVGETLVLHTDTIGSHYVYYPGVTFDSPENIKKFMILFKVPEENQE